MLQLSKDVSIFVVASANQKLLARLWIHPTSLPFDFEDLEKTIVPITFDQGSYNNNTYNFGKLRHPGFQSSTQILCRFNQNQKL